MSFAGALMDESTCYMNALLHELRGLIGKLDLPEALDRRLEHVLTSLQSARTLLPGETK
ncbi:MAG: hypothetical protein HY816_07945 [Candidatus Wallbacteria bacterium]|nr:hypothetical protein [Candidatus Wallbacteria bacterium]